MFKKKSVDANAPNQKGIPQKAPQEAPSPKQTTNRPTSASAASPKQSSDALTSSSSSSSTSSQNTEKPVERPLSGLLLIRVVEAQKLIIPKNVISESSDEKELPYCVIEFDKNQISVTAKDVNHVINNGTNINWKHRAHFDVSRTTEVSVTIYGKSNTGGTDVCIGTIRIFPKFQDQHIQDEWFPLLNEQETKVGEVHMQLGFKKQGGQKKSMTIEEFELLKVIGKGSFGKVMQVRKKDTNRIYAMKIIKKAHIVSRSEVSHTLAERNVLAQLNHPFIVPLKYSFQNPEKLYLVLAFVNGGELFHHLQREGKFNEDRSKFYTAELLCALECLHSFNIIYRDLKPENILLDYVGHIALCDFGLCKLNMQEGNKTNTFCGTPEYLAPELLLNKGYTKVVDWWTLGILLFEMLTGLPPFYDENTNEMYKKILSEELRIPDDISRPARDLLAKLLDRDPTKRLGANGADEIRRHQFFQDINWQKLLSKKYVPPFKPDVSSASDTSNFDQEFTSEAPMDSVIPDSHLSETVQRQFVGFSYQNDQMSLANPSMLADKAKGMSIREQVGKDRL